MNGVTVETIVNLICESLQIKKVHLARMIGLNESSISLNRTRLISEIAGKKTGKRLLPLAFAVLSLPPGVYSSLAIIEGLNQPTIQNPRGYKESVLSAIQAGREIEPLMLQEKAMEGISIYTSKKEKLNSDICTEVINALYA
ncbi:MAG: hypothetical protein PHY47_00790 [Lachnospiraceae bacterium]|nr:hypothetical protein [Lachnospiraceae bacterium]